MAKAELVTKNPHASTWQAIKAALQMRFPGFGGGGGLTSGFSWRIDDDFTRNILRSVARFAGSTIDFAQEAGEPELSSLVMAYVNWLGRSLTEAPLVVMAMDAGGKETPNYMHAALKVLRRPNPFYPGSTLLQAFATSWGIKGNGYWLKARNGRLDKGRNGRGEVFQLWHVPYWMMDARWPPVDSNVFISYYEYLLDGRPIPIDPADVVHFRNGLSDDGRNGVSPLDSVWREIYKDNTEANYGALLARNGAVPPVVLSIKEAAHEPATEDLKAYKESYQASTQGDERGKVFVSNYPIEVTKLGLTPAEMDLSSAHYFNEQRFCAVVGVDVRVLGFGSSMQGSTFSNQADARKAAVENVLCPLWSYLEDELTHQLGPDLGLLDNERFTFDLTRVRVLREDKDALYKRVTTAYKVGGWMKRSEAREEAGLPITPEDDGYYDDLKPAPPPVLGAGNPQDDPMADVQKKSLKSYDLAGLKVARKPTTEEAAQMPGIAAAQDGARVALTAILATLRERLIDSALVQLAAGDLSPTLTLTKDETAALTIAITNAYDAGYMTTGQHVPPRKSLADVVERVLKALRAALLARVTARVIDEYARALLRDLSEAEAREQAAKVLADEPAAYVEELASGAGYEAVGGGRNEALVGMMGPGVRFIYSAILDKNTCERCLADDLKESDDPRKLPHAPNPECLGRWRCRCQIVIAED